MTACIAAWCVMPRCLRHTGIATLCLEFKHCCLVRHAKVSKAHRHCHSVSGAQTLWHAPFVSLTALPTGVAGLVLQAGGKHRVAGRATKLMPSHSGLAAWPQASLLCAVLLGVAMAEVGVSIMHDANHGAGGAGARGVLSASLDMVHLP